MDDINDAVVQLKVIRRTKPKLTKNLTKNLTKTEQKEQNMFYKKYNNVCLHLNRLKRWRDQKKSKYYKNPSDLSTDIINLITNKYSTIKDVENMYFILIIFRENYVRTGRKKPQAVCPHQPQPGDDLSFKGQCRRIV